MVRIRLITTNTNDRSFKVSAFDHLADLPLEIDMVHLDAGPASIESEFDEMLAAPYIVARAIEAERDGIDALVIDCMGDPGLNAARECVSIPVLGPGETSLHLAAMLGHRFCFVTVADSVRPMIEKHALVYGVAGRMTRVRVVDVPVLDIEHNQDLLIDRMTAQSIAAIEEDKADVIVLGCTGFIGLGDELARNLADRGKPAPVIDPLPATVITAFGLVRAGLTHSPLGWPGPHNKGIKGYGDYPASAKFRTAG